MILRTKHWKTWQNSKKTPEKICFLVPACFSPLTWRNFLDPVPSIGFQAFSWILMAQSSLYREKKNKEFHWKIPCSTIIIIIPPKKKAPSYPWSPRILRTIFKCSYPKKHSQRIPRFCELNHPRGWPRFLSRIPFWKTNKQVLNW